MKKVLALGAATISVFGAMSGVSALTMSGSTEDITAEYDVSSAYTVTIPASVTFNGSSVESSVAASNVLIDDGETLTVLMSSSNGKLQNGENSYIPYSFTIGDDTTTIDAANDYELLSVESGNKSGESITITFTADDLSNVNLSGVHSDTLTFKVSVSSAPSITFMQDLADATKASLAKQGIADGSITSLIDSRDSKEYAVAKLGDDYWMSGVLDYAGTDNISTWDDGIISKGNKMYYNWTAAQGVCPEGWTLPSATQLNSIILLPKVLNGFIIDDGSGPVEGLGFGGALWSSEDVDGGAYALNFDSGATPGVADMDKAIGVSVRCVAE